MVLILLLLLVSAYSISTPGGEYKASVILPIWRSPISALAVQKLTMASGNLMLNIAGSGKDPAIRYIKGKVMYYLITSATDFISLDLMSPLVADSVKQYNQAGKIAGEQYTTINFGYCQCW
jgi:hypothetical protein